MPIPSSHTLSGEYIVSSVTVGKQTWTIDDLPSAISDDFLFTFDDVLNMSLTFSGSQMILHDGLDEPIVTTYTLTGETLTGTALDGQVRLSGTVRDGQITIEQYGGATFTFEQLLDYATLSGEYGLYALLIDGQFLSVDTLNTLDTSSELRKLTSLSLFFFSKNRVTVTTPTRSIDTTYTLENNRLHISDGDILAGFLDDETGQIIINVQYLVDPWDSLFVFQK